MTTKPMTPEERDALAFAMDDLDRMEFVATSVDHPDEGFDAIAARMRRVRRNLAAARRTAKQQGDNS
jgi:hypothetical protein